MKNLLPAFVCFTLLLSCGLAKKMDVPTANSSAPSEPFSMTASSEGLVVEGSLVEEDQNRNIDVFLDDQKIPWNTVELLDPDKIQSIDVTRAKDGRRGTVRIYSKP
jgi:hypothetical protein